MTENLDLTQLREVAEQATPGPWQWGPEESHWGDCGPNLETVARGPKYSDGSQGAAELIVCSWGHDANGIFVEDNDKAFIATFSPPTVLALLSRVEKAERSCRLLGTIIERDGKNLVELTNSQDIIPEDGDGDWEVVWERAQEMKGRLEQAEQAVARVRALCMTTDGDLVCPDFDGNTVGDILRALDGDGRG